MAVTARSTPLSGLTWQEFLDLPEEMRHTELVDGEIVVTAVARTAVRRRWSRPSRSP